MLESLGIDDCADTMIGIYTYIFMYMSFIDAHIYIYIYIYINVHTYIHNCAKPFNNHKYDDDNNYNDNNAILYTW